MSVVLIILHTFCIYNLIANLLLYYLWYNFNIVTFIADGPQVLFQLLLYLLSTIRNNIDIYYITIYITLYANIISHQLISRLRYKCECRKCDKIVENVHCQIKHPARMDSANSSSVPCVCMYTHSHSL